MKEKVKILNLYACLGGNRYKWDEVADIEVTAVELDPELARMYQERFQNDKVIVADAHQYLLDHYKEFRSFVKKKTEKGLHITKDAGIFICNY